MWFQRKTYFYKFKYAKVSIAEDGTPSVALDWVAVRATKKRKAYNLAEKIAGKFQPLETVRYSMIYKLDEEIFFKYAIPDESTYEEIPLDKEVTDNE